MFAKGMDISVYQHETPPLVGLDLVMVRATYGDSQDSRWDHHAANVRQAGIVLGAYHFGRNQSVALQVTAFLSAGHAADLFALDWEGDSPDPNMTLHQVREFIERIHASGRVIGLYTGGRPQPDAGQDWTWRYHAGKTPPSGAWDLWQNASGVPGGDHFNGTLAQLREFIGMANLPVISADLHTLHLPVGAIVHDLTGRARHPIATASDQVSGLRVTVGSDPAEFWMIRAALGGIISAALVRVGQAVDKGPVVDTGPTPADVAAAGKAGFADAKDKAIKAVRAI